MFRNPFGRTLTGALAPTTTRKPCKRAALNSNPQQCEQRHRIVECEPVRLPDAPDRLEPLGDGDGAASNRTECRGNVGLQHPLSAWANLCCGHLLISEVEVADANDVHTVGSAEQPEHAAHASVYVEELVEAVSAVEAVADSYAASIS